MSITQEPQKIKRLESTSESEFVSDAFQATTESDLEEIKDGMRKLGIDSMTQQLQTSSNTLSNDGKNYYYYFLFNFYSNLFLF